MTTHVYSPCSPTEKVDASADYRLDKNGGFEIRHYDQKPAFAGFLPGIGGPDGVPLWCLYVNRAQAVSSFGVGNKDNAILEFLSANWAYQLASIQGFRTFCKIDGNYYEPFQDDLNARRHALDRKMWIGMDRLTIQEENKTVGLRFTVTYFSPVNKLIGSLVRMLTISNIDAAAHRLDGLDGLPVIMPAGFTDVGIKTMRRILEAYASVRKVAGGVPFYAAKVVAHDEAEVQEVCKGNFYASWLCRQGRLDFAEPFYDPDVIFGSNRDLVTPHSFIEQVVLDRKAQVPENKLPCAMTTFNAGLKPGESMQMVSVAGMAPNERMLAAFLSDFKTPEDCERLSQESKKCMDSLTDPVLTVSSSAQLDAYTRQNYLDNVLRGGIPQLLPSTTGSQLLHLYSRRHGDAERDYNFFDLPVHPLSSGEGNYRDICQNRRNDIWFYPEVWDREIRMFVGLLQADGYNPLCIKGFRWRLEQPDLMQWCPAVEPAARAAFKKLVGDWFLPGELLAWHDYYHIQDTDRSAWLQTILSQCRVTMLAAGHEGGYWIDHWTYVLDLLEAFKAVYPDRMVQVLTENADVEWFSEPAHVVGRQDKYVHRKNGPLQLDAVVNVAVPPVAFGPVTIAAKLCGLLAIKAVSLDYEGRGIEMEAGRPGWNDAMNGLPGLFGSSTCETAETLRLAKWLLETLPQMPQLNLPAPVADLIETVIKDLKKTYDWKRAAAIREGFREKVYSNTSTATRQIAASKTKQLLEGIIRRCEAALRDSVDSGSGLLHTYYAHQPVDASERAVKTSDCRKGFVPLDITRFTSEPLPLFLEGQVHWLRVCTPEKARDIYTAVRKSPLLDKPLQMYKLNECLERCSPEIGRARTFSRGWFENESIWLHMSTKYLLELVKQGLNEEFYRDAETMLVPFMDPQVYGRSILENSSFIASSDCPEPSARGRGFVARLSGTTAEFIHLWLLLTVGKEPFAVRDGQLSFALKPVLPGKWFTQAPVEVSWQQQKIRIPENAFACALLGTILLVYHNPGRLDTYGIRGAHVAGCRLNDAIEIEGPEITGELAQQIRQRTVRRIDAWLK